MAQSSTGLVGFTIASDLRLGDGHALFTSPNSKISAVNSLDVQVAVKIDDSDPNTKRTIEELAILLSQEDSIDVVKVMSSATAGLKSILEDLLTKEFNSFVGAYRDFLELKMATGDDEAVSRALTSAKLQMEVLSSVEMVNQTEACTLLGLSEINPSATLKRYEAKDKILRFDANGKAIYPLFQFDVAERRIHPALLSVMKLRTDDWGGKMALLHWLTRPNLSLDGFRPCDVISEDGDAIIRSFSAELSETLNG
jgi:hypothetical protein